MEAIKSKDEKKAEKLANAHIINAYENIKKNIGEMEDGQD